jgi:hypothetical protein
MLPGAMAGDGLWWPACRKGRSPAAHPGKTNQAAHAGSAHQEIAALLNNLVVLHRHRGRLPTAQACYEAGPDDLQANTGSRAPEHTDLVT